MLVAVSPFDGFRKSLQSPPASWLLQDRSSAIGAKRVKRISVLVLEHPFSPLESHRELQRITKKKWLSRELGLKKQYQELIRLREKTGRSVSGMVRKAVSRLGRKRLSLLFFPTTKELPSTAWFSLYLIFLAAVSLPAWWAINWVTLPFSFLTKVT